MRNKEFYDLMKSNLDAIAKPLDSLGDFEETIARMGAVLKDEAVNIDRAALIVFCSDNGIIEEGVSQSKEDVTYRVASLLGKRQSSVCHMAKNAGVDVFPVNLGVKQTQKIPGVDGCLYISPGTKNFLREPAMNEAQCKLAMEAGASYIEGLVNKGYTCFLLGEMGIGNTTTSTAVIYGLLGENLSKICGRGAGLSDKGLKKKKAVIKEAYEKYDLQNRTPLEILTCVGGYDIAAMVGAILKASQLSYPVILDGLITAAAALIATKIDKNSLDILFASHKGKERGVERVFSQLNLKPVIDANLALGEGTGAVLFYN